MLSHDAAALIHAVHVAFASAPPRPGNLVIDGADPGEASDVRRAVRGRRWTAVPRDTPRRVRGALSWMTPAARRHYLPLWLVEGFADADVRGQATFQARYLVDDPARRASQLPLFTPGERHAVAACLRWYAEVDAVDRADATAALIHWGA